MSSLDSKIQVKVSSKVAQRVKVVAASRRTTTTELVLEGLAKIGDEKLAALIKEELADRTRPGRPTSH